MTASDARPLGVRARGYGAKTSDGERRGRRSPQKKRKNYTFSVDSDDDSSLPGTSHRKRVRESPFRARARGRGASSSALSSPPALVEDHGFFDYELPLLVPLARVVRAHVLPPHQAAAPRAEDVSNGVHASHEESLLVHAEGHVAHLVHEKGSAVPALKRLGDDIVVVRGVRAAEGAAVHPAFARRGGSDAGGEKTWVVSAC